MHIPPPVKIDEKYKDLLTPIDNREDIPKEWQDTPIQCLIMSQNFGWPIQSQGKVELLISTCIEFRYALPIPRMYAYVIRRASGRVIGSEFSVGYTLSQGVKYLALVAHNDCGMSKVYEKAPLVVQAFVDQGWSRADAEKYVQKQTARHAINDEVGSLKDEYIRLHQLFRKLVIAPLFVCLHDSKFYVPNWYHELSLENADETVTLPHEWIDNLP